MNIDLTVKLSAYSKLPILEYIVDAPSDGKLYGRKDKVWAEITQGTQSDIILADNSGLNLVQSGDNRLLSIKQQTATTVATYEDDTTYYIVDTTPELFVNGGTAFSSGNNEYVTASEYSITYIGGSNPAISLLPINANGVAN